MEEAMQVPKILLGADYQEYIPHVVWNIKECWRWVVRLCNETHIRNVCICKDDQKMWRSCDWKETNQENNEQF